MSGTRGFDALEVNGGKVCLLAVLVQEDVYIGYIDVLSTPSL